MIQITATTKYVRISPRKARLAAALMRGKNVPDAILQLEHSSLKGGRLLLKTLKSAISNAESQFEYQADKLVVGEVRVDEGPRLKRSKPRSRGQRHPFLRRTSHFTVVLEHQ